MKASHAFQICRSCSGDGAGATTSSIYNKTIRNNVAHKSTAAIRMDDDGSADTDRDMAAAEAVAAEPKDVDQATSKAF